MVQAIKDQQEEAGVSSEDKEMGGDQAIPAEGAEVQTFEQPRIKQISAEEILRDQATQEMWLRGVQQNPTDFLAVKFDMQLRAREQAQTSSEDNP